MSPYLTLLFVHRGQTFLTQRMGGGAVFTQKESGQILFFWDADGNDFVDGEDTQEEDDVNKANICFAGARIFRHQKGRKLCDWHRHSSIIWSNFMRTHIGLKICHFLQSVVHITEGPKNKIMRKSGIHSSVPCWDSTLEQLFFYRVSGKNAKSNIFWSRSYSTIHVSKQYFCHKREALRNIMFSTFLDTQQNKKFLMYNMGQNYGCQISSYFL